MKEICLTEEQFNEFQASGMGHLVEQRTQFVYVGQEQKQNPARKRRTVKVQKREHPPGTKYRYKAQPWKGEKWKPHANTASEKVFNALHSQRFCAKHMEWTNREVFIKALSEEAGVHERFIVAMLPKLYARKYINREVFELPHPK